MLFLFEQPIFITRGLTFGGKSPSYTARQIRLVAAAVPEDPGLRFPVAAT
jgi:hypothetical protein